MELLSNFTETRSLVDSSRVIESPYCRIVVRNHPETIVSFSAILCPAGKFYTSRIFSEIPQNVVFLNCPNNSWYLEGIPGLGNSIPQAAQRLQSILDHLGIGNTRKLFWGGSMGGFGAVVFGALANADLVVATGAELALLVEGGNSELILRKLQGRTEFPELPIESWIKQSKARFYLYSGEFAYHDLVSALRILDFPAVQMTTLKDFGHPLPGYLEEVYGLYTFLSAHLSNDAAFTFTRGESGLLNQYKDWWIDLHAVSMNLNARAETRILEGLEGKAGLPPDMAGHCGYALSHGASLRGDHSSAVRHARDAIQIAGSSRFLYYQYAKALQATGAAHEEWIKIASQIDSLSRSSWFEFGDKVVEMITRGYLDSGDRKGAEKFISTQKWLSKDQPERIKLIERLSSIVNISSEWIVDFTEEWSRLSYRLLLDRRKIKSVNGRITLSGAMLAHSPEGQITEIFMNPKAGTISRFVMNHASPGLAKLRPDLPNSLNARFKIEIQLHADIRESVILNGKTADGKLLDWLVMHYQPALARHDPDA